MIGKILGLLLIACLFCCPSMLMADITYSQSTAPDGTTTIVKQKTARVRGVRAFRVHRPVVVAASLQMQSNRGYSVTRSFSAATCNCGCNQPGCNCGKAASQSSNTDFGNPAQYNGVRNYTSPSPNVPTPIE